MQKSKSTNTLPPKYDHSAHQLADIHYNTRLFHPNDTRRKYYENNQHKSDRMFKIIELAHEKEKFQDKTNGKKHYQFYDDRLFKLVLPDKYGPVHPGTHALDKNYLIPRPSQSHLQMVNYDKNVPLGSPKPDVSSPKYVSDYKINSNQHKADVISPKISNSLQQSHHQSSHLRQKLTQQIQKMRIEIDQRKSNIFQQPTQKIITPIKPSSRHKAQPERQLRESHSSGKLAGISYSLPISKQLKQISRESSGKQSVNPKVRRWDMSVRAMNPTNLSCAVRII